MVITEVSLYDATLGQGGDGTWDGTWWDKEWDMNLDRGLMVNKVIFIYL